MGGKKMWVYVACVVVMIVAGSLLSYKASALSYIALGDSFSSGEGELSDSFYQFPDNAPAFLCHNSVRSYPYMVAAQISPALGVHSVACSGAQTADLVGGDDYFGQGKRLISGIRALSIEEVSDAQLAALHSFAPGITRQMEFVDYYHPDLVSIGIGGNDIGMVDKLKACMMPGTCEWASDTDADARTKAGREIKGLFDTLVATYGYLRSRSPSTHFYAVGYPEIINTDTPCDISTETMFNSLERHFMNQAVDYLNVVIQAAAEASGFAFVPEGDAFKGNALCDLTNTPAMNAIRIGDDIAPITTLKAFKLFGNESFHPTPFGHFLLAKNLQAAVDRDVSEGFVHNGTMQPAIMAPREPVYWADDARSLPRSVNTQGMMTQVGKQDRFVLSLPAGSFQPQSDVQVLIHSDVQKLADALAAQDGSLRINLTLPESLSSGFHTVTVSGRDGNGEAVEFYQVIPYDNTTSIATATPSGNPHSAPPAKDIEEASEPTTQPAVLGIYRDSKSESHAKKSSIISNFWWMASISIALTVLVGILYKLRKGT